jgi:hypothetical protein
MLKYFSIAAMVAVLIIFATLGVADQRYVDSNKIIQPRFIQLTPEAQRQVSCLASNIYFEARSEPKTGQIAVAFVTLNRVDSPNFLTIYAMLSNKNQELQVLAIEKLFANFLGTANQNQNGNITICS